MSTVGTYVVKVTVNLRADLANSLRTWAEQRAKTFTQALNEAVALKLFIDEVRDGGGKVFIEQDGTTREVYFQA
jgi:hypothetical protein